MLLSDKKPKVLNTSKDESVKCCCDCKQKLDPYQIFDENIEDISKSLGQILLICGISTAKCQDARSVIKRVFVYHERLRTTCNPDNENRLNRNDLLDALRLKCNMERMEAMLSYAIIKRSFKAFFHGKCPHSISNPIIDALAIHSQEGAWLHAAYRTARIFDNYKAAFFWAHKAYEKQINLVFKNLFKRMQARANPLLVPTCKCKGCSKKEVPGQVKPGQLLTTKERDRRSIRLKECENLPPECIMCGLQIPKMSSNVKFKQPRPITNPDLNLTRCQKCHSPRLICECTIDQLTGEQFGDCGQDSYKVKWYRVEDDQDNDVSEDTVDWDNHHCPIDCQHSDDTDYCGVGSSTQDDDDETDDDDICDADYQSCDGGEEEDEEKLNDVSKLEDYLNQLWAEEIAAKNNPKTYKPTIPPHPVNLDCKCKKHKQFL